MRQLVGTVGKLWRYPVKSTGGQSLGQADVMSFGVVGDRFLVVHDPKLGLVLTAKNHKASPLLQARSGIDEAGTPWLWVPGQGQLEVTPWETAPGLSGLLKRTVELLGADPLRPRPTNYKFQLRPGATFPDSSPLHLVTTGTFRYLRGLGVPGTNQGFVRRLRPNLVLDTPEDDGPVEFDWVGGVLAIGPKVKLFIRKRTERCPMPIWEQPGLGRSNILRVLPEPREAGVCATVIEPGTIGLGDEVYLESRPLRLV